MPRESSDQYKDRSRRRDSPDSSDSEYSQKSSKRKHKSERSRRSRSREKSSSHYRYRRSSSRGKKKSRRSASRSPSRYYSSRRRSPSRERYAKRRSRSISRDRSESHREAPDRNTKVKHKTFHKYSKNDSRKKSSSRSASPYNKDETIQSVDSSKKYIIDDTESKIKKAIKAAEAVGLTMCKLPSYEYKEVEVKEDMPTIQDRNVLDELNSESFAPKQFLSSRSKKIPENIVIDLDSETVKLADVEIPKAESLFHPELFPDEKIRMEKWVRKMFQFRQKALRGEI